MRTIFFGTPAIAVPTLDALTQVSDVVGVVCQPDRPAGRGLKLMPPAVKQRALELRLEVHQPAKVRDGSLARWMEERKADLALVIAYGRILDRQVLSTPRWGCVNLHASLLPKYRGAAPIQRALIEGEAETGVCLMQMDEGMDTGPILSVHRLDIAPQDDAGTLAEKLGRLAAEVTVRDLPRIAELTPKPQDHGAATHAPPLVKEEGGLDWTRPSEALRNHVRGFAPRPGAYTFVLRERPRRLKVLKLRPVPKELAESLRLAPGEVLIRDGAPLIGSGTQPLFLEVGQLDGKKAQTGAELVQGRGLAPGDRLGNQD